MSKRKRGWLVVLAVLAAAVGLMGGVLGPLLVGGEEGRTLDAAGAAGVASAEPPAAAPAGAAPEEVPVQAAEPPPPYGDPALPYGRSIRGRVVDLEGAPVPDAVVLAAFRDVESVPWTTREVSRVRSRPDGTFVLGPLEPQSHTVRASKDGVGVAQAPNVEPGADLELVLAPGARIAGRVTAREGGAPVPAARVVLRDGLYTVETATDADGRYALDGVPASRNHWVGHAILVVSPDFAIAERNNLLLGGGESYTFDFRLDAGVDLQGRVLDARTEEPIAGAIVAEGWEEWDRRADSDAAGRYTLRATDPAPNRVFVARAEGYLPQQQQSDGTGKLDFRMVASQRLTGRVRTPAGEPVADAKVFLVPLQPDSSGRGRRSTRTDADGRFVLDETPAGSVALVAVHARWAPGEVGPIEVSEQGDVAPQEIRLRETFSVEGAVHDGEGSPVPGVNVQTYPAGVRTEGYRWASGYTWTERPSAMTDDDGRFTLSGLLPGKHTVFVRHAARGWAQAQVEGRPGEAVGGIILRFGGLSIEGRVLTADGEPVAGANVSARREGGGGSGGSTTDALGRFQIHGLEGGAYTLFAWSVMGRAGPLQGISAGAAGVLLELPPLQTLRGRVVSLHDGRPIDRFRLNLVAEGDGGRRNVRWGNEIRSPDGTFERPVATGVYRVIVQAAGHAPAIVDGIVVEEGVPPREVEVRMDAGARVSGVVRDQQGRPVANRPIMMNVHRAPGEQGHEEDAYVAANDMTDGEGRYFFEGVAAGTYDVSMNLGAEGALRAQVVVVGTDDVVRDFHVEPTGTITIQAVDEEGKPVEGVYFYLRDEKNGWLGWAQMTNAQGWSTSQPVRRGLVVVQARHRRGEYTAEDTRVQIESGKTVSVQVMMKKKQPEAR